MRRDPRAYQWDAVKAAEAAQRFTLGKTYEAFVEDDLVRSAVERQLEIVGEALAQLAKISRPQQRCRTFDASSLFETSLCMDTPGSITPRSGG
jgi:uncharacterized protein with HEPN domain